ncbi:MAG TPA: hypothetical protein VI006_14630 [Solirubrobacteraceae bacterium]|jgi:hypothetical protein
MNVLTTTWHQLVRRRLWPVALLLLGALAAVPVLLAKDPAPVVPTAPAPAVSSNAGADDAIAEPVVAKATPEDRSRRRRVLGVRKDPFEPAPLPKPKKKKTTTVQTAQQKPDTSANTGGSPAVPALPAPTIPVPVTPAPKHKTYPKGSIIVRFGDATADSLERKNVKKLGPLPDDKDPLLVYMRLTNHGKTAVFLVDESLDPTGDGTCKPHPASCETIELAKGETEFFDYVDPETGAVTAQYELDLLDIK